MDWVLHTIPKLPDPSLPSDTHSSTRHQRPPLLPSISPLTCPLPRGQLMLNYDSSSPTHSETTSMNLTRKQNLLRTLNIPATLHQQRFPIQKWETTLHYKLSHPWLKIAFEPCSIHSRLAKPPLPPYTTGDDPVSVWVLTLTTFIWYGQWDIIWANNWIWGN